MSTAASEVIDDIPEASGSDDGLMVAGETILSITATCSGIRTQMVRDQGWSEEFAEAFSQDLARVLVNNALAPSQDWRSVLEGL